MAAAVVRGCGEDIVSHRVPATAIHTAGIERNLPNNPSAESFTRGNTNGPAEQVVSSSSYILASNVSDLSGDVDRWINGSNSSPPGPTRVPGTRVRGAQQPTVASPCPANSLWYFAAMLLPLFSIHNCVMTLRCTPSTMVNAAEVLVGHINRICSRVKAHIQRLARDQFASEVFAATMDIVLVVYALGFLLLSTYQATLLG